MGASLSYIFVAYSIGSITNVFIITAGTFAIMAVVGYTTKTDLTRFGSLLMMALIGIILAMVVNWFVGSERIDYLISIIGVLVFTGLIAYDTQKIKNIGAQVGLENETGRKLAIMGATSLYLDFINLFLFLLRLLGRRD
jgi:FtsH-binding integral membrane protein